MNYLNLISQNGLLLKKKLSKSQRFRQTINNTSEDILLHLKEQPQLDLPGDAIILHNYVDSESHHAFAYDSYDTKNSEVQDFVIEMTDVVNRMKLTDKEINCIISSIIDDLQKVLKNQNIPELEWQCYGSYANGLACRTSDIDLYCRTALQVDDEEGMLKIVGLFKRSSLFEKVSFLKTARVPLIQLVHKSTGKEVDVSFSNEMGVCSTKLMKLYLTSNDNLQILTLYLKHLLSKYHLHGTKKITTTILFWLIVYFMQHKKLLPSVIEVRRAAEKKHYVSGWDCSIPDKLDYSSQSSGNAYFLLRDFFKFYRDFDFLKYVICPLVGRSYKICDFKNLMIPKEEFDIYLQKVKEEDNGFSTHFINLQHSTSLTDNLAIQVDKLIANKFKILCFYAYKRLPDSYSVLPKMSLKKFLPTKLPRPNRRPLNLKQFTYLCFGLHNRQAKDVRSAVRKVMETEFGFKVLTISPMNGDEKRKDVWFFEYYADSVTWKNFNVERIFVLCNRRENVKLYRKPVCIYIACEVCMANEEVKIWLQSEVHLNNFFTWYLKEQLLLLLK